MLRHVLEKIMKEQINQLLTERLSQEAGASEVAIEPGVSEVGELPTVAIEAGAPRNPEESAVPKKPEVPKISAVAGVSRNPQAVRVCEVVGVPGQSSGARITEIPEAVAGSSRERQVPRATGNNGPSRQNKTTVESGESGVQDEAGIAEESRAIDHEVSMHAQLTCQYFISASKLYAKSEEPESTDESNDPKYMIWRTFLHPINLMKRENELELTVLPGYMEVTLTEKNRAEGTNSRSQSESSSGAGRDVGGVETGNSSGVADESAVNREAGNGEESRMAAENEDVAAAANNVRAARKRQDYIPMPLFVLEHNIKWLLYAVVIEERPFQNNFELKVTFDRRLDRGVKALFRKILRMPIVEKYKICGLIGLNHPELLVSKGYGGKYFINLRKVPIATLLVINRYINWVAHTKSPPNYPPLPLTCARRVKILFEANILFYTNSPLIAQVIADVEDMKGLICIGNNLSDYTLLELEWICIEFYKEIECNRQGGRFYRL